MKSNILLLNTSIIFNVMEKSIKKLGKKSNKFSNKFAIKEESLNASPYFSPRKTRNIIKVEYEVELNKKGALQNKLKKNLEIDKKAIVTNDENSRNKRKSVEENSEETVAIAYHEHQLDSKSVKWEPVNWKVILENIRKMRESQSAPVDTMGCDRCSDDILDEKIKRFHYLVALMLSSQTKDQVTFEAMQRLKIGGLTPSRIVEIDTSGLEDLLKPVSFYKTKAKHLKKTSEVLIEKYDSDIPNTVDELIKLPGVGPKMAHICMKSSWNIVSGIGVDVHVHRISNRLQWLAKPTKNPEQTRVELENWLPFEYWSEINNLLVGFGQTICTPVHPKCDTCLNKDICPSANINIKKKTKK